MNRGKALEILGLNESASGDQIVGALESKRQQLEQALAKAPTDALRAKYEQMAKQVEAVAAALVEPAQPSARSHGFSKTMLADLPQSATRFDDGQAAQIQLAAGTVLAGRYTVIERIGVGGMGAVFRAHDKNRDQDIAIKVLLPSLLNSPAAKERFLDEARISSQLSHPNIVNVYDVQSDGDLYFITMELLEGQNLREYLESLELTRQQISEQEAVELVSEICDGLLHAHELTVHRDIKPENIWITGEGRVKLMDFGIARVMSSSQMTKTGAAMGTAYYMAPEQLKGRNDIDGRADQYALGVMLYEMLSGQVPAGRVDSLCKVNRKVSRHLSNVVDKMLAGNPDERFANIAALKATLGKKPVFTLQPLPSLRPGKFAIAAGVLVAVATIGLAGTGNLKKAWDAVRPYSQEEILAFKSRGSSAEGKVKALSNRLNGVRDAVRDQLRDKKFELRQLENDMDRASGGARKELEQKLAEQTETQRILEAQEELLTTYLIDSAKRGELDGLLAHGKDLMQSKAYKDSVKAYDEALAGYENLLLQAEASANVAQYKYASQKQKNIWGAMAPEYGIQTIPYVDALERDLASAYAFLQNEEFAKAAPLLEKVAVGYAQATDAITSGSKYKESSTKAKNSWESYAKARNVESKYTPQYAAAFEEAEQQWAQQDLVPASTTYKSLYESYTELESAARNASAFKERATRAKSGWDSFRQQNQMKIGLTDQYAAQFAKANSDYKLGEVVDAAKMFAELEKSYSNLTQVAKYVNAKRSSATSSKNHWEENVRQNYARATHAKNAVNLFSEATKLREAGNWTEGADRFVAAANEFDKLNAQVDKHRAQFQSAYQTWEKNVADSRSQISSLQQRISSLTEIANSWSGKANKNCASLRANSVSSYTVKLCENSCYDAQYINLNQYCANDCVRRQQEQDDRNVQQRCERERDRAIANIDRANTEKNGKQIDLNSITASLSRLNSEKPVFTTF